MTWLWIVLAVLFIIWILKTMQRRRTMNGNLRVTQCRGCGANIVFIKSVAGKTIPCNAEQISYVQKADGDLKIVTPNGEVLSGSVPDDPQKATGIGYISHFATCPAADSFRKSRKSDRKKVRE